MKEPDLNEVLTENDCEYHFHGLPFETTVVLPSSTSLRPTGECVTALIERSESEKGPSWVPKKL